MRQYLESAGRFNRGWHTFLADIDYQSVNKTRRDYNQYYQVELACAFANEMMSDHFQPLEMIDIGFLEGRFPYLPTPPLA